MRKTFKLIVLVSLVWPLMMGCERKNEVDYTPEDPNSYETLEDWLDHWTTGDQDSALAVTEANVTGTWELYGWAVVPVGEQISDYSSIATSNLADFQYLQLNADKTFEHNKIGETSYTSYPVSIKAHGTWKQTENRISLSYSEGDEPSLLDVRLLERERMVLTEVIDLENSRKGTSYSLFRRVSKMPDMPLSIAERLMQWPWHVTSDSVYTIREYIENDAWVSTITGVKDQLLPKDAVFHFNEDNTLVIKDGSNNVIGEYIWGCYIPQSYSANRYLLDSEPVMFRSVDNPLNIPDFMYFYPDYEGTTAVLQSRDFNYDDNGDENITLTVYHIQK